MKKLKPQKRGAKKKEAAQDPAPAVESAPALSDEQLLAMPMKQLATLAARTAGRHDVNDIFELPMHEIDALAGLDENAAFKMQRWRLNDAEQKRRAAENKKVVKEAKHQAAEIQVPGVYKDRGYFVLTLTKYDGNINYLDIYSGKRMRMPISHFDKAYSLSMDISPAVLALNLIGRVVSGTLESSVNIYRSLIEMATSKEELMKMGSKALCKEYSRLMQLERPITSIPDGEKEAYIEQMLVKLGEEKDILNATGDEETGSEGTEDADKTVAESPGDAPKVTETETPTTTSKGDKPEADKAAKKSKSKKSKPSDAPAAVSTPAAVAAGAPASAPPKAKSNATTKGIGMASKKKAANGKKAPTGAIAAAKKKAAEAKEEILNICKLKNPFREGSMKAKCFDIFAKGGKRVTILEAIKKQGTADSTASTWLAVFKKRASAGK